MHLSNDAKIMLFTLYKEYLDRRNHGFSKSFSKNFQSANFIHQNLFPDLLLEDVEDTLRELGRNNFLNNFYADNTIYYCTLSDDAIVAMEALPAEIFKSVKKFISTFKL